MGEFVKPAMLPPEVDLVGRAADLEMLKERLEQDKASYERRRAPVRVSIYGVAGVGKSALATRFADSLAEEYPDGVLYVNLRYWETTDDMLDISQILRSFLLNLGHSPDQLPQDASYLRSEFVRATDQKRLIVVLDNVLDYQSVENLVPQSSTCVVILTSQVRLAEKIRSLQLRPLPADGAIELFNAIAPSRAVQNGHANAQLNRVMQACAGLPIAIIVLAARLECTPGYTLARIAADLDKHLSQLTTLFGAERERIEACFRVGYDALTAAQSLTFRRLSIVPGESFDIDTAGFLGDLPADSARLMLDQLRRRMLIEETQDPEYYTMHPLLQQFAKEQLTGTEADEQARHVLAYYCRMAQEKDQAIRSIRQVERGERPEDYAERVVEERNQALEWMEKQHKNLVAAVERACENGQADIAWKTCRALVEFFEIRGKWESWRQTHEAALRVVPKQSIGFAHVSYGLGGFHGSRRHWPDAIECYRTAIAVFLQHGDDLDVGRSLRSLGDAYRYSRNWNAAENCFRRSLKILEMARQPRQVAITKRSMAAIHRLRGQFEEGGQLCRDAIDILRDQRDERWIAATTLSLADIYLDAGDRDARELLTECLKVFSDFNDTHWLTLTRRSLAEALRQHREFDAALAELIKCRESLRQDRDDQWEGEVLHSMGLVHLDQGNLERATELFGEALEMFRQSQDTLWTGRTHVSIGRTAAAAGHDDQAQAAYHIAWPLLVEQGAREDLRRLEALMNGR